MKISSVDAKVPRQTLVGEGGLSVERIRFPKNVVTADTPMLISSSIVEVTQRERNDVEGAFTGHCDGERAQALREIGGFLEAHGFHGKRKIKSTARLMKLLEKQEYFAKSEGHLVELVQTYLKSGHGIDFGTYMLP